MTSESKAKPNSWSQKKKWALFRMWMSDSCCHWCRRPTALIFRHDSHARGINKIPARPDEATLDHLRSRFDPTRQEPANGCRRWVLACWQCNNERSIAEQRAQPIEELHKRSGRGKHATTQGASHADK